VFTTGLPGRSRQIRTSHRLVCETRGYTGDGRETAPLATRERLRDGCRAAAAAGGRRVVGCIGRPSRQERPLDGSLPLKGGQVVRRPLYLTETR